MTPVLVYREKKILVKVGSVCVWHYFFLVSVVGLEM